MNTNNFTPLILPLGFSVIATVFIVSGVGAPKLKEPTDCGVEKIRQEIQTAYVLKPPPAPPPEQIIVKEACPAPQKVENQNPEQVDAREEETREKVQEARTTRKHRYRHWRRRRWILR